MEKLRKELISFTNFFVFFSFIFTWYLLYEHFSKKILIELYEFHMLSSYLLFLVPTYYS